MQYHAALTGDNITKQQSAKLYSAVMLGLGLEGFGLGGCGLGLDHILVIVELPRTVAYVMVVK